MSDILLAVMRRPWLVVVVALAATVFGAIRRAHRAEAAALRASFMADSLEAVHDTTRELRVSVAALGDSLRVVARRAVQVKQKRDALDRELRVERIAREQLAVRVAELSSVVQSRPETVYAAASGRARRAVFDLRQAPYTVHAEVAMPADTGRASMRLRVTLDTIPLGVRLGCGARGALGVRPAVVSVTAPRWASVRIGRVEQAPELCGVPVVDRRKDMLRRFGVAVGYVVSARGRGIGVAIGMRLWP